MLRSPEVRGYRTRSDFTLGFDVHDKPVAGHLMGLFRDGVTCVAPPDELKRHVVVDVVHGGVEGLGRDAVTGGQGCVELGERGVHEVSGGPFPP